MPSLLKRILTCQLGPHAADGDDELLGATSSISPPAAICGRKLDHPQQNARCQEGRAEGATADAAAAAGACVDTYVTWRLEASSERGLVVRVTYSLTAELSCCQYVLHA